MSDINIELNDTELYTFNIIEYGYNEKWAELYIEKPANFKFDLSNLDSDIDMIHIHVRTNDDFTLNFSNSSNKHRCDFLVYNDCVHINNNCFPSIKMIFSNINGFSFEGSALFSYGFFESNWKIMNLSFNTRFNHFV